MPVRQAPILQHELPPAALAENPFTLFRDRNPFGNRLFDIVDRRYVGQVNHRRQVDPHGGHMAVGIVEPGQDRPAAEVHDCRVRTGTLKDGAFSPYPQELPVLDCGGFSNGEVLVNGDNLRVVDNQVCVLLGTPATDKGEED